MEIMGMRRERNDFLYYIRENGEDQWVEREYLISKYPSDLCRFYEQRLIFA